MGNSHLPGRYATHLGPGEPGFAAWLSQLAALFRTVQIIKVKMTDFKPQQNTYQAGEVAALVAEFEKYLQEKLKQSGDADDLIIEIDA